MLQHLVTSFQKVSYIACGLTNLCTLDTEQPDSNQWDTVVHAKASKNILCGLVPEAEILVGWLAVSDKMKNVQLYPMHPLHPVVSKHAKSHL